MIGFEGLPRLAEGIRRYFGVDEIVPPGVIAWLESEHPEVLQLLGIRRWSTGVVTIAANAGAVGQIEVFNPPTAQGAQPLVVVVETARAVFVPAATQYTLSIDPAAGGAPAANLPLDTRTPGVSSQNRILNTQVGASGNIIDAVTSSGLNIDGVFGSRRNGTGALPVVLTPTHRCCVISGTQNQQHKAILTGYEYIARSEELAP